MGSGMRARTSRPIICREAGLPSGDIGREKLIGPSPRSCPSGTRERLDARTLPRLDTAGGLTLRSTLVLRVFGAGSGDNTRATDSWLVLRFCSFRGLTSGMILGIAGTGGVQPAAEDGLLLLPGPGEGDRKVLSVMDPELILLCIPPVGLTLLALLAFEAVDPRRIMRFV